MGFLDRFEKGLERIVNGAFSKTFKSELQPLEIASAIKNAMDAHASVVSREKILVPNHYVVSLSTDDFGRLRALGDHLIDELNAAATRHAVKQKYQFANALKIDVKTDSNLALGQLDVTPTIAKVDVEWIPALEANGLRFVLTKPRTVIGRDASADIAIQDTKLSRQHFEVIWDGRSAAVRDLGSTNGTRILGRPVTESPIAPETIISAGDTQFVFKVIAKAVSDE